MLKAQMHLECFVELLHPPRLDGAPKHVLDKRLRQPHVSMKSAEDEGVYLQTNNLIQPLRIALVDGGWLMPQTTAPSGRTIALVLSFPSYLSSLSTVICGASSGLGATRAFCC